MDALRLALAGWGLVLFATLRMAITQRSWEPFVLITMVASGAFWVASLRRRHREPSRAAAVLSIVGLSLVALICVAGAALVYLLSGSRLGISG